MTALVIQPLERLLKAYVGDREVFYQSNRTSDGDVVGHDERRELAEMDEIIAAARAALDTLYEASAGAFQDNLRRSRGRD